MSIQKTTLLVVIVVGALGGALVLAVKDNGAPETTATQLAQSDNVSPDRAQLPQPTTASTVVKNNAVEQTNKQNAKDTKTFITLAEYSAGEATYAENTKVYFFHAAWCSVCVGIENEINADPSRIPEGTTLIKVDYDTQTALRQEYGVTTQYTFVQFDNSGNKIAKWSAINLNKALEGIQS